MICEKNINIVPKKSTATYNQIVIFPKNALYNKYCICSKLIKCILLLLLLVSDNYFLHHLLLLATNALAYKGCVAQSQNLSNMSIT